MIGYSAIRASISGLRERLVSISARRMKLDALKRGIAHEHEAGCQGARTRKSVSDVDGAPNESAREISFGNPGNTGLKLSHLT
jgi:hypothetical protein